MRTAIVKMCMVHQKHTSIPQKSNGTIFFSMEPKIGSSSFLGSTTPRPPPKTENVFSATLSSFGGDSKFLFFLLLSHKYLHPWVLFPLSISPFNWFPLCCACSIDHCAIALCFAFHFYGRVSCHTVLGSFCQSLFFALLFGVAFIFCNAKFCVLTESFHIILLLLTFYYIRHDACTRIFFQ